MRLFCLAVFSFLMVSAAWAQTVAPTVEKCRVALGKAELNTDTSVYGACGFDDEQVAWDVWAGWVSQKKYKKALYQLCVRWPSHPYSDLYCEKSANLGYGPAIAEQGHRLKAKGFADQAMRFYARALETRMLSTEQEGQVAEQIGLYYLADNTPTYSPAKAVAFFETAAQKRSALANNVMGYLTYSGELGVPSHDQGAFEYLWRAILLGCPAAEENLGLFHLARLGKITKETAVAHMRQKALTCEASAETAEQMPAECVCDTVLKEVERFDAKPYYLIGVTAQTAQLQDKKGSVQTVAAGQKLADNFTVSEIRKSAVILEKGGERVILNLYTFKACADYCKKARAIGLRGENAVRIKPYRLTFSPNECQDLMYYAPKLVDTSLPYVGKNECAGGITAADDPLLRLLTPIPVSDAIVVEDKVDLAPENGGQADSTVGENKGGVSGTGAQAGNAQTPPKSSKISSTRVKPAQPKKEIHFTVGGGASGADNTKTGGK
ncbi:MAG: hypothetical protein ACI4QM_01635 [Alphaproteobacteria bacterium]